MTPAVAKVRGALDISNAALGNIRLISLLVVLRGLGPERRSAWRPPSKRPKKTTTTSPGTYVFDAERSRQGYHLNMFCMSLMKAENRKAFKADEAKYLDQFPLTPEQREAILKRQYNRMLELGGNIYFTAKLGATDGHPFQHLAALMTGSTQQDYADLMLRGGRSVEGNRSSRARFEPKMAKASAAEAECFEAENRQQGKETPWLGSSQE